MNIFSTQKKKTPYQNMSVAPQMSMAKPQGYQSIIGQQSSNPVSKFGQQAAQGQGITAAQSAFKMPTVQTVKRPQTNGGFSSANSSLAPKTIQGSGNSAQYASNPTNYKPSPITSVPTPQTAQVKAPTPLETFTQNIQKTGADKIKFLEGERNKGLQYIKDTYALGNQAIQGQLPAAQDAFNRFKATTEADIADMKASGDIQKGQANDYYGDAQRQAAQGLRDTRGQTQRTFANLGTIDSYGEGSFKQATENTDSEFNRFTQQTLKAKADRLTEIDMQVGKAERQARSLIDQKAGELDTLEKQIVLALSQNKLDEAEALRGQYAATQDLIFQVQDTIDNLKYQQEVEKMNFDLQLKDLNGLSPEFLQTGKPVTQADYMWKLKNPDEFSKAFADQSKSGAKQEIVNVLDKLAGGDIGAITGAMRTGWIPGTQGALTKNYYDQLKSMLSLENRQQLKGSGAISDFEAKILANAASALGQNLSEDQFKQVLNDLRVQLGGGTPSVSNNDPLGLGI